jgi:adenylate cyclase
MQVSEERKLKAILFTDIEGYTAMMQRDEQMAISAVETHRQVVETNVFAFGGQILNYYGDGSLSTFDSAILALRCAAEMQKSFLQARVPIRIGVHTGEILYKGDEFYGDGVNIASRIQSLGVAGSVLFSGDVYDKVKNQAGLQPVSLGHHRLKNVDSPVPIFAMAGEGLVVPRLSSERHAAKRPRKVAFITLGLLAITLLIFILKPDPSPRERPEADVTTFLAHEKSLAVLPFVDMKGEPEQEYFVDGIHESLLFTLSRLEALKVISRTSVVRYKQTDMSAPEIARELDVEWIIEGSVLRIGDTVRITVQLIDGETDEHVWAGQYDRNLQNVLGLISDVTADVAAQVEVALDPGDVLFDQGSVDPAAYDLYLKGRHLHNRMTEEGLTASLDYFDQALSLDSTFAQAWGALGATYFMMGFFETDSPDDMLPKAQAAATRALTLDPNSSLAYSIIGWLNLYRWNWTESKLAFTKALEIDPNDGFALHGLADYVSLMGRIEDGLQLVQKGYELDPFSPVFALPAASHLYVAHRYDEALAKLRENVSLYPDFEWYNWFGKVFWKLGRASEALESYKTHYQDDLQMIAALDSGYAVDGLDGAFQAVAEELASRYVTGSRLSQVIGSYYAKAGNVNEAIKWLERACDDRIGNLYMMKVMPDYDALRGDPRFQRLLRKMKLPTDPQFN